MGYSFSVRMYFGPDLLASAAYFTREAKSNELLGRERELRYNVTAAIMMSAFSLEAMVNELITDTIDKAKGGAAANLSDEYSSILSKQEKLAKDSSTLRKLNKVLKLLELPLFNFDDKESPYEAIVDLFYFRNRLVHYEPSSEVIGSTILDRPQEFHQLEKLFANRFSLNPMYDPAKVPSGTYSHWTQKLLGHGAAQWSVQNSILFYEDYNKRLGLPPPFDGLGINLLTS